ncbi:metallophosphoesterase family protein [bacterium]|nr:metallophosphoesterase family protein [bacterium]
MKIAIMSDIHGNMDALDAVLKDIEKQHVDKIFLLGDYVMAGPEPIKTLEKIIELSSLENTEIIQGNTDLMIASYTDDLYEMLKTKAPIMAEALKNDVSILNSTHKDFLKNLPVQKELEIEGIKFLLTHGSPRRNNEDILPTTTMEELNAMLQGVNADVILCGHTHIPCGIQTENKKTVVNDGSVGRPFTEEAKACYLLITIRDKKCLFEHQLINYDNIIASKKLSQREFNGAERLANTLINPTERHF